MEDVGRVQNGRWVSGVGAGIAARVGVDPVLVRIAFVLLSLAGGAGVVLYGLLWMALPVRTGAVPVRSVVQPRPVGSDPVQSAALGAVVLGTLLLLRSTGLWFPDALVWPVVLGAIGLSLLWGNRSTLLGFTTTDAARPAGESVQEPANRSPLPDAPVARALALARNAWTTDVRKDLPRLLFGVLFVMGGAGAFIAANGSWGSLRQGLLGGTVLMVGLVLILGPWLVRLSTELGTERRARIRSEERAEVAAHLHDSVLQTLAIIQRQATDPRQVVALARRQERELRGWLYGDTAERTRTDDPITLGEAVQAVANEVEDRHGVQVEVVRVGDLAMDDDLRAVALAAKEALVNAAKHAGVTRVDVFAEVQHDTVDVFVRDRGRGFDPSAIGADRRGVLESITGRMARHGGTAEIRSEPGAGTEVHLHLQRKRERP